MSVLYRINMMSVFDKRGMWGENCGIIVSFCENRVSMRMKTAQILTFHKSHTQCDRNSTKAGDFSTQVLSRFQKDAV